MATEELLITLGLNANNFDSSLKSVTKELKRAEQEFKTTEKAMGGFEKSAKGVEDKIKALERVLNAQKSVVTQYKSEIDKTSQTLKDQVTAQNNLKKKLDETKRKFEESSRTLGSNAEETKKLERELKSLDTQFTKGQAGIGRTVEKLKDLESQSKQAETKVDGLEKEIEQLQTEVNSFDSGKIKKEISSMDDELKRSTKSIKTSMANLSTNLKSVGSSLTGIGAGLTAGISAPLTILGKKMLDLGSESQEMQNKFDVVFKTTAKEVESWSNTLSKAIGRSNLEIKTAVSNSADLMIGMGMSEKQAFDLSSQFIELAYDLASFNNTTDTYAIEAMTKAMMGETEMAKGLGVNLSVATMENNEYVKSLGKSWNALTQSEKAQAYLNEAMKQSTNAIGDAERSSGGYANMTKRLQGQLKDLGAEMGQILIPIATKVVESFSKIVEKFSGLSKPTQKVILGFMGLGVVIPPLIMFAGMFITALGVVTGALASITLPMVAVVGGLVAVGVALVTCKDTFMSMLPPVEEVKSKFMDFAQKVQGSFQTLWTMVQDIWNNVGKPIFDAVAQVVGTVVAIVIELLPTIAEMWNTTVEIIKTAYETIFKPVFDFVVMIIKDVADIFAEKMPMIVQFVQSAWDTVKRLWEQVLKPVFDLVGATVSVLIDVLRPLWESFKSIISNAFNVVSGVWNTVLKPVFDLIITIVGKVVSAITGNMETFKSVISGAMNWVLSPIKAVISAFEGLMNMGSKAVSWISDKVGGWFGKSIDIGMNIPSGDQMARAFKMPTAETFENMQLDAGIYTSASPMSSKITSGLKAKEDQTTGILNGILKAVSKSEDEPKGGGLNVTIENFINNREQDIEQLCRELEFYRKRISY